MTQEEKDLLLKDLCGRLPYKVKVEIKGEYHIPHVVETIDIEDGISFFENLHQYQRSIEDVKPYLRPLSAMTEDERNTLRSIDDFLQMDLMINVVDGGYKVFDYLNSIHVDYRGLISKGLALEVTKEKNPYNIMEK